MATMIPIGYMAKRASPATGMENIFSVSGCISAYFIPDYIKSWKHNDWGLFDSPAVIKELAQEASVDLAGARMFYYEAFELEFDEKVNQWRPVTGKKTNVAVPGRKKLEGYDLVDFSNGDTPGHSPLSCNSLGDEAGANKHCLLDSLDQAKALLESEKFKGSEPGPYRIFAVYSVG